MTFNWENKEASSLLSPRNFKNVHLEPNGMLQNENPFYQQRSFHNLRVDIDLSAWNRSGIIPEVSLVRHIFPCKTCLNQSDGC